MKSMKRLASTITLLCVCMFTSTSLFAADADQKLFVNLTSDEINRATMAIEFGTKALTERNIPVTINLSVEGTRIADKNIPETINANGDSLKGMLARFMEKGGRVLICAMCMNNVGGLAENELIDGIQVGGGMAALFEEGTRVLSF